MHNCLYCYATYIPRFYEVRTKKKLLTRLEKEVKALPNNALISMSNSSDPYPKIEKEFELTRNSIKILSNARMRLLIITKSDMVKRDIDLLSEMKSAVSITITTFKKADVIETNAPHPTKRLRALKKLKKEDIPVILRLDPIIPFINDVEIESIIKKCRFVDHIVTSTLKLRRDSYSKISHAFPELKEIFYTLYFKKGEKIGNSWYLPIDIRKELLNKVAEKCEEFEISYGFCREGLSFKAKSCDGSHLTERAV